MLSIDDLFKGPHFDLEIIILRALVSPVQARFPGSRGNDCRARNFSSSYDDRGAQVKTGKE
jgi:hypothetical protein